ncbi:MAG: Zn-ribbon domain-containing OB-fold protein, partial [Pseudomonadota bacterium]
MSRDSFTSAEFYKHLHNKKLMGTQCNACREVYLPPRPICIKCFSTDISWKELSGRGTLRAFTSITVGPTFMGAAGYDRKNPYCCGIVALEEGPQVSGQILGVKTQEPNNIRIGTPLTLEII